MSDPITNDKILAVVARAEEMGIRLEPWQANALLIAAYADKKTAPRLRPSYPSIALCRIGLE